MLIFSLGWLVGYTKLLDIIWHKHNNYHSGTLSIGSVKGLASKAFVKTGLQRRFCDLSLQSRLNWSHLISGERLQTNLDWRIKSQHYVFSGLSVISACVASSSLWLAEVTNSSALIGWGSSGSELKIVCFRSIRPLPDHQLTAPDWQFQFGESSSGRAPQFEFSQVFFCFDQRKLVKGGISLVRNHRDAEFE